MPRRRLALAALNRPEAVIQPVGQRFDAVIVDVDGQLTDRTTLGFGAIAILGELIEDASTFGREPQPRLLRRRIDQERPQPQRAFLDADAIGAQM